MMELPVIYIFTYDSIGVGEDGPTHQPVEHLASRRELTYWLIQRPNKRIAVEQASTLGWDRFVGSQGRVIGMHTFGASAPLKALQRKFGFLPEEIVNTAKMLLGPPR